MVFRNRTGAAHARLILGIFLIGGSDLSDVFVGRGRGVSLAVLLLGSTLLTQ